MAETLLPPAHQKVIRRTHTDVLQISEPQCSGMRLKTLIVDDEPIARKVLREELESIADVDVIGEADNGAVALHKIAEQRPDLVLLDLQMPVMGGLDVVRNIRRGTHMPVIVIRPGQAHDGEGGRGEAGASAGGRRPARIRPAPKGRGESR
jgi:CheY-like chemotaxis protein